MIIQIEYRNVSKRYPQADLPALNDVNLSVNCGEMLALVGESGSGKTTLLRLAAGLETPDSGEIFINGKLVAGHKTFVTPERRHLGMVAQEGALFPHLNLETNIGYGISQKSSNERKKIVGEMLELIGLGGYQKRFPHELSGGERQRVALARALAPKPDVIFLDEPFSSLDATLRRSLRDSVCGILKTVGATAILVVHDPEDALSVGDRIAVLHKGSLKQISRAQEAYYNPSNEYCARLFGPANAVVGEDALRWMRPEEFSFCTNSDQAKARGRITHARNVGRYWELQVQMESPQSHSWILHSSLSNNPKIGEQVLVTWAP